MPGLSRYVFLDKYVNFFLNFPQHHSREFKEKWKKVPSLGAVGFEGYRLLESSVRHAVKDASNPCYDLLLNVDLNPLGNEIISKLFEMTDHIFSNARYAGITLDQGDQRRLLRSIGEELTAVVLKACEILATTVLDRIAREGVPIESGASIETRRQKARAVFNGGISGSLDQAIKSLQTSVYDNTLALAMTFTQLLAADGWEDRVSGFCDLVLAAGPVNFFEPSNERKFGPGDLCLVERIKLLFSERQSDIVLRGLESIQLGMSQQGISQRWDVRGEILLDHCFVTVFDEILSEDQTLAWALPRLVNMVCAEPVFLAGRLQGYIDSQKDKAIAWLRPRAEAAVAGGNLNDIGAAGRAAELLLPVDHSNLLTQAARSGFAQMLSAGPKDKPQNLINEVSRLWRVDANKQWRESVVEWLAWRFVDGAVPSSEQFERYASQLIGNGPDPALAQNVYEGTLHFLMAGDRDSPSNILANTVNVLNIAERWITGPVPVQGLRGLRELILEGVSDLPGELMLTSAPHVVEVVSQLRASGWYFSLGGAVAIVAGRGLENCYALTPNGIFRSAGIFHPYAAISKVEPVQGWTQHYVKYQIGDEFFELNKLGAMAVANFLSTVIGNGMRLARQPSDDEVLNLFAGRDAGAELYLDRWAGLGQLVLVTDERKMLPASLARERMLLGLMRPASPLSQALPVPDASPATSASSVPAYGLSSGGKTADEAQRTAMSLSVDVFQATSDLRTPLPVPVGQTDLPTLIRDLCSQYPGKGMGIGDGIDARKLQSARKAFPMPLELKVFGLMDTTMLGTNEKGLAITANGIYWKNGWTQESLRNHLSWREFNEIQIEQRFDKFGFGLGNFFETTGSSYPNGQLNNLLSALQASLRLLHITDDGAGMDANDASPPEGASMEQLIEWACNNHSGGGIAVGELINPKKLANARKEFPIPASVNVIGLVDCTAFGSNKIGLAICADGIYWKNDWTTKSLKTSLSWSELSKRDIGSASREVLFGHDAVVGLSAASVKPTTLVAVLKAISQR